MPKRPCIWLTRPKADSDALAADLSKRAIDSIVAPVMRIMPSLPATVPAKADAVLLTSRHAAHALVMLPDSYHNVPIFCIGPATGEAAKNAGFKRVLHGENDVIDFIPRITQTLAHGTHILYLAGEETRTDIEVLLRPNNITVTKVITYQAQAEATLPETLIGAIQKNGVNAVTFFSPRSAAITADLLKHHNLTSHIANMDAYCLSLAVAEAAAPLGWRNVHSCAIPTAAAMRDLIVSRAPEVL